jgi:short-subunit dehydrogenase
MTRSVTLITGASAGLGVEFARLCAARGDELVLVARRRDRLEALAAEIGGADPKTIHIFDMDLSEHDAPVRLIEGVEAKGLTVDTLINNAGFGGGGLFANLTLERQAEMIDLNVRALSQLSRLVLTPMLERRRGAILNVASTAAFQPGPGAAVYFATKAYVLSFTEALHQELKGNGVKVSALCPGATATEFGVVAGYKGRQLARFTADPKQVAEAGLDGLARNKAVVIPGLGNKATAQASRFLPRAAIRRIVASMRY